MAQISSVVTTSHIVNSQGRNIRDVSKDIYMLYPNETPLLTFLADPRLQKKAPTKQAKFEWFEDDYTARWAANGTTTVANTTASTTITVTDGTLWVAGDLGYVPRAVGTSTAGEIFRVTNVSSNELTVVRGVNSQVMTIDASAPISLLGPAYEENSSRPSPKATIPVGKYGFTQIFRHDFAMSRTSMKSDTYGAPGGEFERAKLKRFKEHKLGINRAFLWGHPTQSFTAGPSGYPITTTAGVNSVITTNVIDGGTTLTKSKWDEVLRTAFMYGDADTKLLVASPKVVGAINSWAQGYLQIAPETTTYGLNITKINSNYGNLWLMLDWMLEDPSSSSTYGFGGWAFILNPDDIRIRVIDDTKYIETDIHQDGVDGVKGEYLSELGLEIRNEKHHVKLYNVLASS